MSNLKSWLYAAVDETFRKIFDKGNPTPTTSSNPAEKDETMDHDEAVAAMRERDAANERFRTNADPGAYSWVSDQKLREKLRADLAKALEPKPLVTYRVYRNFPKETLTITDVQRYTRNDGRHFFLDANDNIVEEIASHTIDRVELVRDSVAANWLKDKLAKANVPENHLSNSDLDDLAVSLGQMARGEGVPVPSHVREWLGLTQDRKSVGSALYEQLQQNDAADAPLGVAVLADNDAKERNEELQEDAKLLYLDEKLLEEVETALEDDDTSARLDKLVETLREAAEKE